MIRYVPLILSGVTLNALAQILIKKGMLQIGHFAFSIANAGAVALKVAVNPSILAALTCYIVSVVLWMLVLSRVEVSFAYPFLSIGYILTAVVGYFSFGEGLSAMRIMGIGFICLGVVLISRS